MRKSKSLWHLSSQKSILREEIIPTASNLLLGKAVYSNISTGTERLVAMGNIPKELQETMKVPYQKGDFNFPVQYGYSMVIKIEERYYHLMHPHQDYCLISVDSLTPIPTDMDLKVASQIANMETVINAVWDSKLAEGRKILVCGFGSLGSLLAVTLAKEYNLDVYIKESNPHKLDIAKKLGFKTRNFPKEFSVCYNTTANEKALQFCVDNSCEEGTILELSWYGNRSIQLNLGGKFHTKRLHLKSVQVSEIPIQKRDTETYKSRKYKAIDILEKHSSTYKKLITNEIPFIKSPDFFNALRQEQFQEAIINIINY